MLQARSEDKMKTDYDAIVRVASLWLTQKLDEVALPQIDKNSVPLVVVAAKLIEGKQYGVSTDSPDTIRRCRLLAQHLGASLETIKEDDGRTSIILSPPPRQ
jgi:hypothetical protein